MIVSLGKPSCCLLLAGLSIGFVGSRLGASEAPGEADDFALIDHWGKERSLSYFENDADLRAVVLVAISKEWTPSESELETLRTLTAEGSGFEVWGIDAHSETSRGDIRAWMETSGLEFPGLIDPNGLVSRTLGLTCVGETLFVAPKSLDIMYRGPLTSDFESAVSQGAASLETLSAIAYAGASPAVDYSKHIGPMLRDNCAGCHTKGGVGPFSLSSYRKAVGWSEMIREVTLTRRMPPWQADPEIGHFSNDFSLNDDQRELLIAWIDAGAPRGEGPDPLEGYAPEMPEWAFGEPDFVVEIPEQRVEAEGVFPYRYVRVESPFQEDVWLGAVEIKPGNTRVLHHIIASSLTPVPGQQRPDRAHVAGYAPGMSGQRFPENTGRLLKAGSTLLFQLHYTASGKDEVDNSKLALYVLPEPPLKELHSGVIVDNKFKIPPGAREYVRTHSHTFQDDVLLLAMNPHMHLRGKSMRYEAHYPDGEVETLLNVPAYNFNWQRNYYLEQPKRLPKGTRLVVHAAWDNSELNPYNPAPDEVVKWGDQTFEEMFYASFQYLKADENLADVDPEVETLENDDPRVGDQRARRLAGRLLLRAARNGALLP